MPLAEQAAAALRSRGHTIAVFEATTGGLVNAALQSVHGASAFTTCGAVTYSSRKGAPVLGGDLSLPASSDASSYILSKQAWTQGLARAKRRETGATWCVAESGACGPTFLHDGLQVGFTALFIAGPVERGLLVHSTHAERESNMWGYTKAALDLIAETIPLADGVGATAEAPLLRATEDRYGGVEIEVSASDPTMISAAAFDRELHAALARWEAAEKRGLWLKLPLTAAACLAPAVAHGFAFHHAQSGHVLLTRWLPSTPSPLPAYAFTQIGVGGVVLNSKGEVLMVQERISPMAQFQNSWKLPGGLADPGEHFAETVAREVLEETGVTAALAGVVSIRHSHGYRFGQGDLYVLVKLLVPPGADDAIKLDPEELRDARWMSRETIASLVEHDPKALLAEKVSVSNFKMISNALDGRLIVGSELATSRPGPRPALFYAADNGDAA